MCFKNTGDLVHTEKYKSGLDCKFDFLHSFTSRPEYSGNFSGKEFFHSGTYSVFTCSNILCIYLLPLKGHFHGCTFLCYMFCMYKGVLGLLLEMFDSESVAGHLAYFF